MAIAGNLSFQYLKLPQLRILFQLFVFNEINLLFSNKIITVLCLKCGMQFKLYSTELLYQVLSFFITIKILFNSKNKLSKTKMIQVIRLRAVICNKSNNLVQVCTLSKRFNSTTSSNNSTKSTTQQQNVSNDYYDIVVVGGGMVGTAMARALGKIFLKSNLKREIILS
jgi:hypothetical protein